MKPLIVPLFSLALTFFLGTVAVAAETSSSYYARGTNAEQLPPFPQCSATCPAGYHQGSGDTCTAVGRPGQTVSCRREVKVYGGYAYCRAICEVR